MVISFVRLSSVLVELLTWQITVIRSRICPVATLLSIFSRHTRLISLRITLLSQNPFLGGAYVWRVSVFAFLSEAR